MIQAPPARSLLSESEWPMIVGASAIILAAIALISLWMSRAHSRKAKLAWTVLVIGLPIVGALGWFALGRVTSGGERR